MIPCNCTTIQGTWKQSTSYVIMSYLKCLQLQVEVIQMVFRLHHAVRVELDVHSLHSLWNLVQNNRESQWSLSHPFKIWVNHLSSSSSFCSLSKFDGFSSEFVGSPPPLLPPLPSPPPPTPKSNPEITRVPYSSSRKIGGSSPSSIDSSRPSSLARNAFSTDDTKNPVGVAFGFLDVCGRCCTHGINLIAFANWRVTGWTE